MTNDRLPEQGAILLIDKSEGPTSHDVVAKARRALGTRKVGHAGTLDPMATGLLVLGAGPATRLLTHLVGLDKAYAATIRLGAATVTDDREGERIFVADPADVAELAANGGGRIAAEVARLTGEIEQAPSAVSAIKVDGRRAYDRVRAGERVELKRRPVTIHAFESGEPREAADADGAPAIDVDVTVSCSSGTYIRALARDLGGALGVGGHLTALRRTRVGPFDLEGATPMRELAEGRVRTLRPPAEVAATLFPVLRLDEGEAVDLGNGKRLEVDPAADGPLVAAISPGGRLVGLVEVKRGRTRVVTNFPVPTGDAP